MLRLSPKFSASATNSISRSSPSKVRIALRITAVSSASRTLIHIGGGTLSTFWYNICVTNCPLISNVGYPTNRALRCLSRDDARPTVAAKLHLTVKERYQPGVSSPSLAMKRVLVAAHVSLAVLFLVQVFISVVLPVSVVSVFVRIVFFRPVFFVIAQIVLPGAQPIAVADIRGHVRICPLRVGIGIFIASGHTIRVISFLGYTV